MSDPASSNAIELRGLAKTYPGGGGGPPKAALAGVDLDVPEGAIFGLLGPNGAGKSTLINILAGLTIKSAGSVRIWGFDQDRHPRQSRAAIGVVPQELNIDPFFTPRAALEVQAGLYGVPRRNRRTAEILAAVGLADKADAYARRLSGGMKRRLLIAKALVHNPPVLVLDEPTAGVDIELRRMLWSYVRELNDGGTTVILTTHYLEEAEAMCDRIGIIDQGRLVAHEATADLVGRLDGKTLRVVPAAPLAAVPAMPPDVKASFAADGALLLAYHSRRVAAGDLLDALAAAGVAIKDISVEEPSLEDAFVALTRRPAA